MWCVESPDRNLKAEISLDAKGKLTYQILCENAACVSGSLGINTDLCDFTRGLAFKNEGNLVEIREEYSIPAGKKSVYTNNANELELEFEKDGTGFITAVRMLDNGAAFRYIIKGTQGSVSIKNECTTFEFPAEAEEMWIQQLVASYEAPYNKKSWSDDMPGQHYGMPLLMHLAKRNQWLMINEANVLNKNGEYCISHLECEGARSFKLVFALEEKGKPVKSALPFSSPWRYIQVEKNLDGIVNSTVNYNLNPPAEMKDTSWIKPARAMWAWWSSDMGAQNLCEAINYVDFAAEMGFEAVVLDAGWDETWIKHFCAYAHEKGVSPWLWTAMQSIDTYEKANHYLPLWKSWGIDGVKIDFFENDSAYTAWQYSMMAEIMAREKLMINFHGSTKPMGEGRTWPHFIAAEGVMGLEHYKWSGMPNAEHNCTLPFTRNAVGPMDYTPVGFTNANRNTTMGHQMALAAVFESGCQHYGASIYSLEAWSGTGFLRRLKAKYDGVKLLSGYPGDHAAILRWTDASREYVIGCICNAKRYMELKLDFLPEGEFEAEIYSDNRSGDVISCNTIKVTQESVISVQLPEHGGAGVYIAPEIKPLEYTHNTSYMNIVSSYGMAECKPILGSSLEVLSDERPLDLLVLRSSAKINVEAARPGYHTLRLCYSALNRFKLAISNGFIQREAVMHPTGGAGIFAVQDIVFWLEEGINGLVIRLAQGGAPMIKRLSVVANAPKVPISLPVETARLTGGVLSENKIFGWAAQGLTNGDELVFDNVLAKQAGEFIIRINYFAGPTGSLKVYIEGNKPITAKLGGVGVWGATKNGDILSREILVALKKGSNTIRLCPEQSIPPVSSIEVIAL